MALSNEDKKDVSKSFGKGVAKAISGATRDGSPVQKALDKKGGKELKVKHEGGAMSFRRTTKRGRTDLSARDTGLPSHTY